jgi:hypothetical protein
MRQREAFLQVGGSFPRAGGGFPRVMGSSPRVMGNFTRVIRAKGGNRRNGAEDGAKRRN